MRKMILKIFMVLTLLILTTGSIGFAVQIPLYLSSDRDLNKEYLVNEYSKVVITGPIENGTKFKLKLTPGKYKVTSEDNGNTPYLKGALTIKDKDEKEFISFDSKIINGVEEEFTSDVYYIATYQIKENVIRTIKFTKISDSNAVNTTPATSTTPPITTTPSNTTAATSSSLDGIKNLQITLSGANLINGTYYIVKGKPLSLKVKYIGIDKAFVGVFLNDKNISGSSSLTTVDKNNDYTNQNILSGIKYFNNEVDYLYLASYGGKIQKSSLLLEQTKPVKIKVIELPKNNEIKPLYQINGKNKTLGVQSQVVYQEAIIKLKLTGLKASTFAVVQAKDLNDKVVGSKLLTIKNSETVEENINIKDLKITTKGTYKLSCIVGFASDISTAEKALLSSDKIIKDLFSITVEEKADIWAYNVDGEIIVLSPKKATASKVIKLKNNKYILYFENEAAAKTAMKNLLGYDVTFKYLAGPAK